MKLKSILRTLLVCLCLSMLSAPAASGEDGKIYIVKKGDTLWDICQKYYNEPFL
ncbi:MAG: LysM peptidoglycan-binding domain-containing protein, partial [Deltaproteobacteria bacterium]|nr:LysM peptidoglycan-binding domain-containing protein [Deltaproteobacteria bacterium]